jgi:dTDP-4-amino-4,6-dideoxygalactose transaminase
VVPYATFGNCINLDRYERLGRELGVGIVVDAAASLGSVDEQGRGFGTDFPYPVVFSMHATKSFAVGEAGSSIAATLNASTVSGPWVILALENLGSQPCPD